MKVLFTWALLVAVSISVNARAQVRATQAPFSVAISAVTPEVEAGRPVIVDVTVTNTSKHEIDGRGFVNETLGMDTYDEYDIRDSEGNPVEKKTIKHPIVMGRGELPLILKPGESKKVSSDVLGIVYDMSHPGEYTIQLSRRVSYDPKAAVVKSNKVMVTVTP
jgi:hypothetical protein